MDIYFFSDNNALKKRLGELKGKKKYEVSIFNTGELRKTCRKNESPVLVYLDIEGFGETYEREIRYLSKKENLFFGIIDSKGKIEDVARLFFAGAVDYIRKTGPKDEIKEKRFGDILAYLNKFRKDYQISEHTPRAGIKAATGYKVAQNSWANIVSGEEYAFSIMFVELDEEKELEKKYGRKNFKKALNTFISFIKKHIKGFDGRIWFWSSTGGVVLFPFDGTSCPAVLCGFRLMLFKHIYDVEESLFASEISFRIALHIGNVQYTTGDGTGEIISDTINSVFHLGKSFNKPDSFTLTDEVYTYAPPKIKEYFISEGKFENREIFRMKNHTLGE